MYCKRLAHIVMEAGSHEICRMRWPAGNPRELMFQFKTKNRKQADVPFVAHVLQNPLSLKWGAVSPFFLSGLSPG